MADIGAVLSVEEVAARLNLKPQKVNGEVEWHGANPLGGGATDDGFILYGTGNAWDRKADARYTSWQVAEMAGIPAKTYAPCADYIGQQPAPPNGSNGYHMNGNGHNGHGKKARIDQIAQQAYHERNIENDFDKFDIRDLKERGITLETRRRFQIGGSKHPDYGTYWEYPTFHPDGQPGWTRRKIRFPQQTQDGKTKYLWIKKAGTTQPIGYNLESLVEEGRKAPAEVWLLNGEVSVWLWSQRDVAAISSFGEGNKLPEIFQHLKSVGVKHVNILFDYDDTGITSSLKALEAATKAKVPFTLYTYPATGNFKVGYDAADLWEQLRDEKDFLAAVRENLIEANDTIIAEWRGQARAAAPAKEKTEKPKKKSATDDADIMLERIEEKGYELFRTDNDEQYIVIERNGHKESLKIDSQAMQHWLDDFHSTFASFSLEKKAIETIIRRLCGKAAIHGVMKEVFVRVGGYGGDVYIDLCNDEQEIVRVGPGAANGWEIVNGAPVYFRRTPGVQPLMRPERVHPDEKPALWERLRGLLNAQSEENWVLMVAWILSSYRPPIGNYPALSVSGEEDSGKTESSKMLRQLIDPSRVPLTSIPKEPRDLFISAKNRFIQGYDNLSSVPSWLSDAWCQLVTYGSFSTRKMRSDDEEALFFARRPILFNGIEEFMGRSDLQRRCLFVKLPFIPEPNRVELDELWSEYWAIQPKIIGMLLDAVATATANLDQAPRPRGRGLLDFRRWIAAAEMGGSDGPVLPWEAGTFDPIYSDNLTQSKTALAETSPLIRSIIELAGEVEEWEGTPTDLFKAINKRAAMALIDKEDWVKTDGFREEQRLLDRAKQELSADKSWPSNPVWLSRQIPRIAPALRERGILMYKKHSRLGQVWIIKRNADAPPVLITDDDEVDVFEDE